MLVDFAGHDAELTALRKFGVGMKHIDRFNMLVCMILRILVTSNSKELFFSVFTATRDSPIVVSRTASGTYSYCHNDMRWEVDIHSVNIEGRLPPNRRFAGFNKRMIHVVMAVHCPSAT